MINKEDIVIGMVVKDYSMPKARIGNVQESYLSGKMPYVIVRWNKENYSLIDLENIEKPNDENI